MKRGVGGRGGLSGKYLRPQQDVFPGVIVVIVIIYLGEDGGGR